jgi:hypothetical protein
MSATSAWEHVTGREPGIVFKRFIGSGGYGSVFEVLSWMTPLIWEMYNSITGSAFARKILNPNRWEVEAENESRVVRELCMEATHPNLVRVFDMGLMSPFIYKIDMELYDTSLDAVIQGHYLVR